VGNRKLRRIQMAKGKQPDNIEVEGQVVMNQTGAGAKENNEFETLYDERGDNGAASLPKVQGNEEISPVGQETR
jgi:hypothetical protein